MYDMLIMLKAGEEFSPAEMQELVKQATASGPGQFEAIKTTSKVQSGESYLQVAYNNQPYVIQESEGIAKFSGINCAESTIRFEMSGSDFDMMLFNDYLFILDKLMATGKFYLFDPEQGKEYSP